MKKLWTLGLALTIAACASGIDIEGEKGALLEIDREFSRRSQAEGTSAAFLEYMAEDVRLLPRTGEPVEGKETYRSLVESSLRDGNAPVYEWEPLFADVASSGDLGYTFGRYVIRTRTESGLEETKRGYYVTIWKRQPDGEWKFVFDTGNEVEPDA